MRAGRSLMLRAMASVLAVVLSSGVSHAQAGAPEGAESLRVLFIGNSLTAANDLPAMVAGLASAGGQRPLVWKAVLQPGASLEDHWNAGEARRAIRSERWDFVVLQQGPSALPESRVLLRRDAALFAAEIRGAGARPALYMVWPSRSRAFDFDGVSFSYRTAARDVRGLLLPVGEAWRAAWSRDLKAELYSADGFHPTAEGSYLAALVLYGAFYEQTPLGLPPRIVEGGATLVDLPPAEARVLQEAAAEANRRFGKQAAAAPSAAALARADSSIVRRSTRAPSRTGGTPAS
jgi:hypothetical protein